MSFNIDNPPMFAYDKKTAIFNFKEAYYPIGNSLSTDIIQGCHVGEQCDILLLGCGDVRNILHTLYVMRQDKTSNRKVNIYVNDIEAGILARDLILLYLIRNIDPGKHEDLKFLWAVWYDVVISEEHLVRLNQLMQKLTQIDNGVDEIYFGNDHTKDKVKQALTDFVKMKLDARAVIERRTIYLKTRYQFNFPDAPVNRVSSKVMAQYQLNNSPLLSERYKEEIRDYVLLGVTRVSRGSSSSDDVINSFHGNMTFFRPGNDKWNVEDNSSPYMCYDPGLEIERYDGLDNSMSSFCLEMLKKWIQSFQKTVNRGCQVKSNAKSRKSDLDLLDKSMKSSTHVTHQEKTDLIGENNILISDLAFTVYLWLGEATAVCEKDLPADLKFDFIDTSNISDRVGLIPVLVSFQSRLKQNTGVLRTEVFHWRKAAKTVKEFLRVCLDIPLLMYPTVLGLHLAEELSLGHECDKKVVSIPRQVLEEGTFVGLAKLKLRWRVARPHDKITPSKNGIFVTQS